MCPVHILMTGVLCPVYILMTGVLCPVHILMTGVLCLVYILMTGVLCFRFTSSATFRPEHRPASRHGAGTIIILPTG